MYETWKELDLRPRRVFSHYDGELICLRLVSKSDEKDVRYEVGRLETIAGVTWLRENYGGCERVADLRRQKIVTWARLPQR